jgi:rhodanese-related sulfurtransferase
LSQHIQEDALRGLVASPEGLNGQTFSVLRELSVLTNSTQKYDNDLARELTIRLLENRGSVGSEYQELLTSLICAHGLYPYIAQASLTDIRDILAYETARPAGLEGIVFHRVQASVYYHLIDGDNVILSAPTSFGKSLIIDALLASGKYKNVVIVVPTLALIDETRRRLSQRFGSQFKIVTHPSQDVADQTVFVYTQERVVDHGKFPPIDLFVIDEFYKLNSSDEERSGLLNQALYRLIRTGAQFYFLGPNVERIASVLPERFNAKFIQTDFSTIAIDVRRVRRTGSDLDSLGDLCRSLDEPTLIYCQSPRQTRVVARALVESGISAPAPGMVDAANWIASEFDPDWLVGKALRQGIGVHNGRVPRALAQFMVRAFNSHSIRFLVCTSTLIEGVNTAAKNVIIFSDRIANQRFDFFTFNNIRGRSGRMFQHFVGHVYLFHDQPSAGLPTVDIPLLTQPSTTPTSLLIQLEDDDLTQASRERLEAVLSQDDLSLQTIRESNGVSPERQVDVARELRQSAQRLHPLLAWRGFPRWEQLRATCELAWKLSGFSGQVSGVSSAAQLAYKLNVIRQYPVTSERIKAMATRDADESDGDERVEGALEFTRQWASHHAPRLLLAVDRIQREVFGAMGMSTGNYGLYVNRLQSLFMPGVLAVVDEYGLPVEIASKIAGLLDTGNGIDGLLDSLRNLEVDTLSLTRFERRLLSDTKEALGPTTAQASA